jgi:hypothetical protein
MNNVLSWAITTNIIKIGYETTHINTWIRMRLHRGGSKLLAKGWRSAFLGIVKTLILLAPPD